MIVVDTSAVVAIIRGEPETGHFVAILDEADDAAISAVSLVETNMVICGRRQEADPDQIATLLQSLKIGVVEVTKEQAMLAVAAFLSFGKGRHRAALNLADCFAYALAKARNAPLLYKGDDFSQTDVAVAWRP
jgi:ribonuclease VapC